MAEITPGGILDRVAQEIPAFFRDGVDQLVTGEGEYIRSGEPQGTVGKIGQAVARSYCRQYGADPGAAKFGNAARIENACRPYLDDLDPGEGAEIESPADGGQCAAVPYGARYTWISAPGANPQNYTPAFSQFLPSGRTLYGPLTYVGLVQGGGGICNPQLEGHLVRGFFSNGTTPQIGLLTRGGTSCLAPDATDEISGLKFERLTAGSECGDMPPVVRQPRPIADPTPPPFRFFPGPGGGINVGVDVLPDGTINVNIGGPTVNVDPFPSGGGDAAPPSGPPPGDIGDAGGSADTGLGGETEGEAGAGEVLVGLKIDILASPTNARQFASGVFRGAGYIYMGVASNLDQDYGGSMLKSGQFFFAEKDNLTHWQVSANNGYNWRVTPYYREVEE